MPLAVARRGLALGLTLTLVAAGTAFADELKADADVIDGVQNSVDLGEVAPGAERTVDIDFALVCKGLSHLSAGVTFSVDEMSSDFPEEGDLVVTSGEVTIPADWPADDEECGGDESAATVTPAKLEITAPMTPGPHYAYTVFFTTPEGEETTNLIATTVYLDVVVPEGPDDTTPPEIHGLPGDIETTTTGASKVVTWSPVTAVDDTDPNPTVECSPASGSAFDLGTTTVKCTATDASGNQSTESFHVTVNLQAPTLSGTWGKPLDAGVPALTGRSGRTIPLKLSVTAAGRSKGSSDIAAPTLLVQKLSACATDADVTGMRTGGTFAWSNGDWQLNLDTTGLVGCARLVARVSGETVATAIVQLAGDGQSATKAKH
jgi:hypothetical protein